MNGYWAGPIVDYRLFYRPQSERVLKGWDKSASLKTDPDELDIMLVAAPLPCGDSFIEPVFRYNGASVGPLRYIPFFGFSKWRHPIATARHDFRIELAELLYSLGLISADEYDELRKTADGLFKEDISIGQTNVYRSKWEQTKGYIGVRLGATWRKVSRLWR